MNPFTVDSAIDMFRKLGAEARRIEIPFWHNMRDRDGGRAVNGGTIIVAHTR